MPQLQTFSLRGRSRLAQRHNQRSAAKRREYDTDSGSSSDSEDERVRRRSRKKKASLASVPTAAPPQYTVFPTYPAPAQPVYRHRKKTSLAAAKPAETRLASANNDSFFTVNLNLFTLLAIIGIVIMIVVMFNLKNQVAGLENKMQVMLLTTM